MMIINQKPDNQNLSLISKDTVFTFHLFLFSLKTTETFVRIRIARKKLSLAQYRMRR